MARDIAMGLVIGGAVDGSLGKAVKQAGSQLEALQQQAAKQRLWQQTIGETQQLQRDFQRLKLSGDDAATGIQRQLESNLLTLKKAGIELQSLDHAYQQLGRTAKGLELQASGHQLISQGMAQGKQAIGDALKLTATVAVPTLLSANYQDLIRDIVIKAGQAGTAEEARIGQLIAKTASEVGIARNELAEAVNQMVGAGMELQQAVQLAPSLAKFSVSQRSGSSDTARMMTAMVQNAGIVDPQQMQQALESIAYLGKEGSFEASDMAKWFPQILAESKKLGITGVEAIVKAGAALQVMMKVSGSSDEAATILKNWMSKMGAMETKERYTKVGIDYPAVMQQFIQKGWDPLLASFKLAQLYIEKSDPEEAARMSKTLAAIDQESNQAKKQAMLKAFAESMKAGDLFTNQYTKAALTAAMQNEALLHQLVKGAAGVSGELDKDLRDRRVMSKQIWAEVVQAWDEAARQVGDALRPLTDTVGSVLKQLGLGIASLAEKAPLAIAAITTLAGGFIGLKALQASWSIGKGALAVAQGTLLGGMAKAPGYTTNLGGVAGKSRLGKLGGALGKSGGYLGGALALGSTAYQIYDTAQHATTSAEKGAGYGDAVGGLAGGLAGAKLGALVGAWGGPLGIAIGGVLGSVVGTLGGGQLGGWLGKSLFGSEPPLPEAAHPAISVPDKPSAEVNQQLQFSPTVQVTVQGEMKDPKQLANDLMPHLHSLFEQFRQQQQRTAWYDTAHS